MNKVLSISVAAYNVQAFIEHCLDSFIDERVLERVEVLIVDDGSKDNTAKIVKEYEKKYPNTFKLIQKENGGAGSTVNVGIQNATGKYFRMVDGDDWVNTKSMPEFLDYLEAHETDMVCTHYCCVDNDTFKEEKMLMSNVPFNQEVSFDSIASKLDLFMHNVTFKTEHVKKIRLDNGFYTDVEYLLFPTGSVQTVVFLDIVIYMYRVALGTQSMNIRSLQKNCAMHELVLSHLLDFYKDYCQTHSKTDVNTYIENRIAQMMGAQLLIYLSLEDTKYNKEKTIKMVEKVEADFPSIYKKIMLKKTFKILKASHYLLFSRVSKLKRKELKL